MFCTYEPKVKDIALWKGPDVLVEIHYLYPKYKQVGAKILKCHMKEREGEVTLINNSRLKKVWRRKK